MINSNKVAKKIVNSIVVTSVNVIVKSRENFLERELKVLQAALITISAHAYDGDLFLNPPQVPKDDPTIVFDFDLVFTKAIEEQIVLNLTKAITTRFKSVFRLSQIAEPKIEYKRNEIIKN